MLRERAGFMPLTYSSIIQTLLDYCFYNVKLSFKYQMGSTECPSTAPPVRSHVDAVKFEAMQSSSRAIISHIFFKI